MSESTPTDNPGHPEPQSETIDNSIYGAGTTRKPADAWYVRAGRAAKHVARRAVLPLAITTGLAAASVGGFYAGAMYERYETWADSLEQRVLYKKDEISVTRKNGKLYLKRDVRIEQEINTNNSSSQPKIIDYDGPGRI